MYGDEEEKRKREKGKGGERKGKEGLESWLSKSRCLLQRLIQGFVGSWILGTSLNPEPHMVETENHLSQAVL